MQATTTSEYLASTINILCERGYTIESIKTQETFGEYGEPIIQYIVCHSNKAILKKPSLATLGKNEKQASLKNKLLQSLFQLPVKLSHYALRKLAKLLGFI